MAEELPANTRGRVQRCVGSACTSVGQLGSMAGTFVKNTAYPAAKVCVGSTCSKAGELGSAAGQWTRNTAYPVVSSKARELGSMAGTFIKNTAYPAVSTCVGDSCLYALARVIGYNPTFSNGLTITANDRGIVDAISSKKKHEVFSEAKLAFVKKLTDLIEGKLEVMDDPDTEDVEIYKSLAKDTNIQGIAKGLYLLNLASMSRPLETPNELTVASILIQANLGNSDNIMFDSIVEQEELISILKELSEEYTTGVEKAPLKLPTAPPGGWFSAASRGEGGRPASSNTNKKNTVMPPSTTVMPPSTTVLRPIARRWANMRPSTTANNKNTGANKKNMGGGKRKTMRRKNRKQKRRTHRR